MDILVVCRVLLGMALERTLLLSAAILVALFLGHASESAIQVPRGQSQH